MFGNKKIFVSIILIKLILICSFSSDYQDKLFIPFVDHFIHFFDNPWQYFFENNLPKSFPYPPLMLYILTFFHFVPENTPHIIVNALFKIPTLVSDFLIYFILSKLFPSRIKEITIFYFTSPIIFYASYMHSQLDLIPTSFLFLAIYLLMKNRIAYSSLVFGLAISIKFHVIAALPLIILYLFKNKKKVGYHLCIPLIVYLLFSFPFIFSEGYRNLVLMNNEQNSMFNVYFIFNDLKVYLAPLAVMLIYARFAEYSKINNALLFSALGLLFSVFILVVPPMPAWYVWVTPYVSIYFINHYLKNPRSIYIMHILLNSCYLIYFLCFHKSGLSDLNLFGENLNFKVGFEQYSNLAFTFLEASLLAVIYILYRYGLKSNAIYKKKNMAFAIGIGGDSGSGKSTLLTIMEQLLHKNGVLLLEGDGDHRWERGDDKWNTLTHLNPKANFLHRQTEDIIALKRGEQVERVVYDHESGKFTDPKKINSNEFVIITGLHPFYLPKMRQALDLKIYLETEESLRRHWKVLRDTQKRGYSLEKVLEQIEDRMHDAEKYIWPQKKFADLVICYFSETPIKIGDPNFVANVKLKIIVDSSINLEPIVEVLRDKDVDIVHDYSDDLETHFIIVDQHIPNINYELIADQIIQNRDEILLEKPIWSADHRGLMQLMIVIMISEKMKEVATSEL
ncbi:uridine kinase [Paenibacillus sp. FSL H7-0331]|uniref:uridine kinase n=1 Tax=Paenibacillus sp. FSL H7-0331 TaxID=1920421 RepID=UPI0015C3275A|nr:uridine kinase [Paenibacillus sp. FSL H7-0331]